MEGLHRRSLPQWVARGEEERGGEGRRGHCDALYSLLNVRKLLILWPAISAGQIERNFSLIAVEQLPAVAQWSIGRGHAACSMPHGACWAEGTNQNGRLLGPTGQLNAPIALWPLTQIANCQLQLAPPRRSIDRSIVASMPSLLPPVPLPPLPALQRFGPRFADILLQTT